MIRRLAVAALAAVAVLAAGTATASATPSCRGWKVQGQSWFAAQSNGYTLMFTLRTASNGRLYGYAQQYQGMSQRNLVGSQLISGGISRTSQGYVQFHLDIHWSNGQWGQYNALAYGTQSTSSGTLTATLRGTTVDMTGSGASAKWIADGLEGPLGDTGHIRPLYCPSANVVR
jgi:hypothetical protein